MKHTLLTLAVIACMLTLAGWGQTTQFPGFAPRIYIPPQDPMESYLPAAMIRKHVPAVITTNKDEARFVLTGVIDSKTESAGSKIARCIFTYCVGINGTQTATVRLIDGKTQDVVWAFTAKKGGLSSGGADSYKSSAETIAKNLKRFLEQHPQ